MLAELFGTLATPLIFLGLLALGIGLVLVIRWSLAQPAQPEAGKGPQSDSTTHGGLPKII